MIKKLLTHKIIVTIASIFLFLIVANLLVQSPTTKNQLPTPTPTPFSTNPFEHPLFSQLQKTRINVTTENEVKSLPNIISKESSTSGITNYSLTSVYSPLSDHIFTRYGKVIFESTSLYSSRIPQQKVSDYIKTYGKPEETIIGNTRYGEGASSLLFTSKGFVIIGNTFTDEVYEIDQFPPMTPEAFKKQYGYFIGQPERVLEGN